MNPSATDQAMQRAVQNHMAGRLAEAEEIYRQILAQQPDHADALHLLGVTAAQRGRSDLAIERIGRAIAVNPRVADYHYNLGNALRDQGRVDEAIAAYQEAIRIHPSYAEAYSNLGNVLHSKRLHDQAITALREAIRLDPLLAEAHSSLGVILEEKGFRDEGIAAIREALRLQPEYADAHYYLGNALRKSKRLDEAIASYRDAVRFNPEHAPAFDNLGTALYEKRLYDEAIAALRTAVELIPQHAEAHYNLGNALREREFLDESIAALREAVRIKPGFAEAYNNLGFALRGKGLLDEAIAALRQSILLKPNQSAAHNNLGGVLRDKGSLNEAIAAYRQALHLKPDNSEAHYNLAQVLLSRGEFEEGWREYEWRWRRRDAATVRREFVQPVWDGKELNGRRILLYAEQGLGDTIQFVRYVPMVVNRGGRVVLECQEPLIRLLRGLGGVEELVSRAPASFDVHCPLVSLPLMFGTRVETIPAAVPYLHADSELSRQWAARLTGPAKLKVGVVWAGSPGHKNDRNRSLPLASFAPLAQVAGVSIYSLQKGEAARQALTARDSLKLIDHTTELNDVADTAALIANLDLVITVDTSVAHLAGAMGRRTWVLLPFAADWRWLLERDDSPWYPAMRLFRQKRIGDWAEVMERVSDALAALIG